MARKLNGIYIPLKDDEQVVINSLTRTAKISKDDWDQLEDSDEEVPTQENSQPDL